MIHFCSLSTRSALVITPVSISINHDIHLCREIAVIIPDALKFRNIPLAKIRIPAPVGIRMCVLISTSPRSVLHIGNRLIIFRKLSSIFIPEILHTLARVKVTIGCAVKLPFFHSDPAAGVIPVAVGINSFPLRLITKIPFIHDLSA